MNEPPGPSRPPDDESIPTLTEIVDNAASEPLREMLDGARIDWTELSRRIEASLVAGIDRHADALYGAQLKATLRTVFDRTAEQMAAELQVALSQLTRKAVAEAVAEEIARLRERL